MTKPTSSSPGDPPTTTTITTSTTSSPPDKSFSASASSPGIPATTNTTTATTTTTTTTITTTITTTGAVPAAASPAPTPALTGRGLVGRVAETLCPSSRPPMTALELGIMFTAADMGGYGPWLSTDREESRRRAEAMAKETAEGKAGGKGKGN